jgi:hypothetical protein
VQRENEISGARRHRIRAAGVMLAGRLANVRIQGNRSSTGGQPPRKRAGARAPLACVVRSRSGTRDRLRMRRAHRRSNLL